MKIIAFRAASRDRDVAPFGATPANGAHDVRCQADNGAEVFVDEPVGMGPPANPGSKAMELDEQADLEVTAEQIEMLRELGVPTIEIEGLSMADAEALIAELRDEREASRR